MKRISILVIAALTALSMGCNNTVLEKQDSALKVFEEQPISITWKGDATEGIQSYQTNIQVYRMNNRKDTGATLSQTYRLAVKTINEKIYTRLDFDGDGGVPLRSIISNGEEAILFDPATEAIEYRIPLESVGSPLYRLFGQEMGVSRINLSLIREEAKRLSLDIEEDSAANQLLLDLPPAMIPQNGADRITRSRAVFDISNDTLISTEVIMIREDETLVTTTATSVYEDKDGIPVKIGMITVINSKAPGLIEGFDPDTPVYNSPDDIPTISDSDFEKMRETGNLNEIPSITFGDPADLSYTETIYEVYRDIEINTVPEQLFRLIQQ